MELPEQAPAFIRRSGLPAEFNNIAERNGFTVNDQLNLSIGPDRVDNAELRTVIARAMVCHLSTEEFRTLRQFVQPEQLIEVRIEGKPIEDVVRLSREYVHEGDTVWVMKDGELEIRETEIVFRDAEYAYIRGGLETGEEIVTTTLATVADGVGLRKISEATEPSTTSGAESTE